MNTAAYHNVPKCEENPLTSFEVNALGALNLARISDELDAVLVPAGSLDEEPPVKPQHHIFWDSRAAWSCESTGLPEFKEYPT